VSGLDDGCVLRCMVSGVLEVQAVLLDRKIDRNVATKCQKVLQVRLNRGVSLKY
jgi:hypothetical protein